MRAALLALLLLPTPPAPVPDILMPGQKSVQHDLVLRWDAAVGDVTFFAYPTRGFHGAHRIEPDAPFRFSSKYATRIYAVPAGATLPEEREAWLAVGWPSAPVPVVEVGSTGLSHPLARVETVLRVTGVGADGIGFEPVSERRFDSSGRELGTLTWLPLVLVAAAGAAMLLVLSRRARAAAPPTP